MPLASSPRHSFCHPTYTHTQRLNRTFHFAIAMQHTSSAGQPGQTEQAPALGTYLDQKPEVANPAPQSATSEEHTSAGPKSTSDEFTNAATGKGVLASFLNAAGCWLHRRGKRADCLRACVRHYYWAGEQADRPPSERTTGWRPSTASDPLIHPWTSAGQERRRRTPTRRRRQTRRTARTGAFPPRGEAARLVRPG